MTTMISEQTLPAFPHGPDAAKTAELDDQLYAAQEARDKLALPAGALSLSEMVQLQGGPIRNADSQAIQDRFNAFVATGPARHAPGTRGERDA